MIVIEALAAGIVGVALLWLVLQPLLLPVEAASTFADIPDPEETPRGQALLALKEIEFDRATGKLSDEDFESLHARYTTAALATLASEESAGDRVTAKSDHAFCTQCGSGLPSDAKFCAECATPVR